MFPKRVEPHKHRHNTPLAGYVAIDPAVVIKPHASAAYRVCASANGTLTRGERMDQRNEHLRVRRRLPEF